jgi:hypothetical protein
MSIDWSSSVVLVRMNFHTPEFRFWWPDEGTKLRKFPAISGTCLLTVMTSLTVTVMSSVFEPSLKRTWSSSDRPKPTVSSTVLHKAETLRAGTIRSSWKCGRMIG